MNSLIFFNAVIEFNKKIALNIHMKNKGNKNDNLLDDFEINDSYLKRLNKFLKEKKILTNDNF